MAERIQLRRQRGWRMPEGAMSVARPTIWGNPFRPGDTLRFPFDEAFGPVVRDRAHAVEIFACYADIQSGYKLRARWDLSGWSLACWCPLPAEGEPDICHAAILLAISNEPMDEEESAAFARARAARAVVTRAPRGLGRPKENADD